MAIYFTRYDCGKLIKMLSLYYHKSMRNTEEHEEKTYLMADKNTSDKVLDKIKKKSIKKFDDTKILIEADDKLPNDITLKM